ncbi:MAG: glycosyltransferase family 39 protein [Acidobacteria bacterium]|nr:glycosyltransferase family 39 protein [Acidobacteriota bacterium]
MRSSSIRGSWPQAQFTETLASNEPPGARGSAGIFLLLAAFLLISHAPVLRLPYFWDEAGYYIPAARDLVHGSLIPHSTPSNAHPPLVLAWLAVSWKIFGENPLVTRCAMLVLAAFSLLGFFRLALATASYAVAVCSTALTAIYPVFFAQSSLAHVDLAAAGLTFWGMDAYMRGRRSYMVFWFALASLAKETAILVPIALLLGQVAVPRIAILRKGFEEGWRGNGTNPGLLIIAAVPLTCWYIYHYLRTGFVFGNAEFFHYNVEATLHPVRIILALLLRIWQLVGYPNLYVLTVAAVLAMNYPASTDSVGSRPRIPIPVQARLLVIVAVYLLALSVLGGAVLARYMLPVVPLVILVCVSTVWRRLRRWKTVMAIVAAAFITALFINPPYGFSPEDNLAYRDYIRLHREAEALLASRYPQARVLTAWPASDELSRPYLGYVERPLQVVRIEDFTAEQLLSAADARSRFDVALVFSTKYQPPNSFFDRWRLWQAWKARYFGYHRDMAPDVAASILGGSLVYVKHLRGQWVGIIEVAKFEEARLKFSSAARPCGELAFKESIQLQPERLSSRWQECVFTISHTCRSGLSCNESRALIVR